MKLLKVQKFSVSLVLHLDQTKNFYKVLLISLGQDRLCKVQKILANIVTRLRIRGSKNFFFLFQKLKMRENFGWSNITTKFFGSSESYVPFYQGYVMVLAYLLTSLELEIVILKRIIVKKIQELQLIQETRYTFGTTRNS